MSHLRSRSVSTVLFALLFSVLFSGCGVQSIPQSRNNVAAAMSEINNQYLRRSDMIGQLVGVVKGAAKHERETLEGVINARARATQITLDPSKTSPEQLQQFQQAQGQLSQALGRLMVVSENYPQLQANANFRDLQAQIEGTENRITVARNRYIAAVQEFNNLITVPPTSFTNMLFYHHAAMPQWGNDLTPEQKQAPKVEF